MCVILFLQKREEVDSWDLLASQLDLIGKLQINERLRLKTKTKPRWSLKMAPEVEL